MLIDVAKKGTDSSTRKILLAVNRQSTDNSNKTLCTQCQVYF